MLLEGDASKLASASSPSCVARRFRRRHATEARFMIEHSNHERESPDRAIPRVGRDATASARRQQHMPTSRGRREVFRSMRELA
jgi:hypothetical protein